MPSRIVWPDPEDQVLCQQFMREESERRVRE
jgi:hypothetical protein